MMAIAALVGLPTVVIDIGDWTNAGPALPPSAHHLLIITTATSAASAVLLWAISHLAEWLDARQAARAERVQQRQDDLAAGIVDELAGRLLSIEARLPQALDEAHGQGYDRGWLHGSTGQPPETHVNSAKRSLRSV